MYVSNWRPINLSNNDEPAKGSGLAGPLAIYAAVAIMAVLIVLGLDALGFAVQSFAADLPLGC